MRVGKDFVRLLQNERHYIIAMFITYVGLRNEIQREHVIQIITNTP
jgi:hypothetical protein